MNTPVPISTESALVRKRQSRGEASRRKILDAALALIPRHGLHGLTHRVIATEAGVPLSMTTYFFASLADLIEQAFDHFLESVNKDNVQILDGLAMLLDDVPPDALLHDPATRRVVATGIAREIGAFIRNQAETNSVGLAVELNFLSLYRLEPGLRAKVVAYRDSLADAITALTRRIGSNEPALDASLFLAIVHRLQFECMNRPPPWPESWLEAEIHRMLSLVLKLD